MRATSNDAVRTVLAVLIFGLSLIFLIPPPSIPILVQATHSFPVVR